MRLPEKFLHRMRELLKDEFEVFIESYEKNHYQGLRVNTLKISIEDFLKISPFKLKPIPWCQGGFYYEEHERPAKHPYYHAGLYYIQEPSAMAPGAVLDIHPGDNVLDLCAAPGGKTVQMAGKLQNQGILVTNDINLQRVKALIKNVELYGIKNAIVTNESPQKLHKYFHQFFQKILVDAPCSGEGMFRKDEQMVKSWEKYGVETYVKMQEEIVCYIDDMLMPGGEMLYSTCTFSPEENEGIIHEFLQEHKDFELKQIPQYQGFGEGKPEWIHGERDLKKCARLWPHKLEGEGHFLASLRKLESEMSKDIEKRSTMATPPKEFIEFITDNLFIDIEGCFEIFNDQLYLVPAELPVVKGLKILRSGWLLGTLKKNRFEPSQALAMGLKIGDVKRVANLSSKEIEVVKYLKGETLHLEGEKGWTLVSVDGFPLGWAKQTGDMLKNYYPPAWRWID